MSIDRGKKLEEDLSLYLHRKYPALLISSRLLRQIGCGQIDISFVKNETIYIIEAKSSGRVSRVQKRRLEHSGNFLANIMNLEVEIWVSKNILPKGPSFTNLNS